MSKKKPSLQVVYAGPPIIDDPEKKATLEDFMKAVSDRYETVEEFEAALESGTLDLGEGFQVSNIEKLSANEVAADVIVGDGKEETRH